MGYVDEIRATWVGLESLLIAGLEHMLKFFELNKYRCNKLLGGKQDCQQQEIPRKTRFSLYSLKALIAESLCKVNLSELSRGNGEVGLVKRRKPGSRPKTLSNEVRLDCLSHWPVGVGSGNRCSHCRSPGCSAKPVTKSEKCDADLSVTARDCFKRFHTVKNL